MAGDEVEEKCPVCNEPAVHRCSGCKGVSYCSKDHQKTDWKRHKNSCKAYEVANSPELGRYLVATKDLNPGDIIITETPLIFAPKSTADPENLVPCVGCYTPVNVDVGERCPSCGWPICSAHCKGLKDLEHHGLECLVLSLRPGCAVSNIADYYRYDALLALRILLTQKKFQKKCKKIMELQSHIEDRGPNTEIYKEADSYIVRYLKDCFLHPLRSVETELKTNLVPDVEDKTLHTICGIIDVNSLDINMNNGCEISALYFNTSMMEHNCIPNTKHHFETNDMDEASQFRIIVKAAVPIKKGEHITTMYSHALWGTQARREHLKDTKYFKCYCERCKDPSELETYLSAMRCLGTEKEPCGGIQLPENPCDEETDWCCSECPVKIKNSQVAFLISNMGEEIESVQSGMPNVKQLEALLDKLLTFLHPNHYHLYSVKHSLVQLYGHQDGYLHRELNEEVLKKKATMCEDLLKVTLKIDPGNSRLSLYTGVLYYELFQAKFEFLKRKAADKSLRKSDLLGDCDYVKKQLNNAMSSLEDEIDGSPGQRLTSVFREGERNFERWMRDNKIAINGYC